MYDTACNSIIIINVSAAEVYQKMCLEGYTISYRSILELVPRVPTSLINANTTSVQNPIGTDQRSHGTKYFEI